MKMLYSDIQYIVIGLYLYSKYLHNQDQCLFINSLKKLLNIKGKGQRMIDLHRRDEGTVKAHNPKNKSTAFQENTLDITPGSSLSSCVTWATY